MDLSGRCENGYDKIIASTRLAESLVVEEIGNITEITTMQVKVSLKADDEAQLFQFSRAENFPS